MAQKTGKAAPFVAAVVAQQGDVITNAADKNGGFHVVIKDHVTGMTPPLPGMSNDFYHYSFSK